MANRVVQLNEREVKRWNIGCFYKSLIRVKNPYYEGDLCEIRNSSKDKLGYAKVIEVRKVQSRIEFPFLGILENKALEANIPPAPIITLLIFELLDKWEGQE